MADKKGLSQQQINAQKALQNNMFAATPLAPMQLPTGPKDCPPPQRVRRCPRRERGMSWLRIRTILAKFAAELFGCMAIGFVLPIRDFFILAGLADPGFVAAAAMRSAVTVGLMLAMMMFKAGHFNPIYTVIQWLCEEQRWELETITDYLAMWIGQFFGYLFSAWIVSAFLAAPLSCTIINPLVGNGFGYLFESLGHLFLVFVFALAVHRRTAAMTGVIGLGAAEFAWVASFGPLTGGSFNFFRSLGVALVQGAPCTNSLGYYVAAMFTALVVGVVVLIFVLSRKVSSSEGHEITIYDPPPMEIVQEEKKN